MACVALYVDGIDFEQEADVAAVVELLRRERPALTFDELGRVDRRLHRFRSPPRSPRRGSRLGVVICLALGLVLMTAGTGLAIGGFATSGFTTPRPAVQAPNFHRRAPARRASARRTSRSRPQARGTARTQGRGQGTATSGPRPGTRRPNPSRLGQAPPAGTPTTAAELSLNHAETRNDLPFTGLDAIPILLAGILLIVAATSVNRRTRGSWGPV